ncbi:antibiotic biosynthesis monooxygenase family protein [uncultured Roseibium sp.]|uniref:antibiotic biosynthesis monooxygenase family protein n=1 Tax=uncultured Roseibium sp. TaxID=1936171 RepID=UPI002614EA88|nr:antibiotic biosynthesis monooxygenase family protein [uncultured Roseibium sp.]
MKNLATFATALALALGSATAQAQDASENVVLINAFTVPVESLDEAIAMWDIARDFLDDQPGYVSTKLHRSLSTDATYLLINVAQWETAEQYKAATTKMRDSKILPRIEGVIPNPNLYEVIRD